MSFFGWPQDEYDTHDWMPHVFQNGYLTLTDDSWGVWAQRGEWLFAYAEMKFTGGGSATNAIYITNPPFPSSVRDGASIAPAVRRNFGTFLYLRSGTAFYTGQVIDENSIIGTSGRIPWMLWETSGSGAGGLGNTPSFAVANNDTLSINISIPVLYIDRANFLGG